MAARDEEERIGRAIESILAQTFADWELLVVDDGSRDRTAEVARSFADSRIAVVQREPVGLSAALNWGLDVARAPLLARQDADDRSLPQRLGRQVEFLDRRPEVCVVGSAWVEKGPAGEHVRPRTAFVPGRVNDVLPRFNPVVHSAVMFRRDVVRSMGGYDVGVRFAQDYDLWLRLARAGETLWNLDESLVVRVMSGANVAARYDRGLLAEELRIRWRDVAARRRLGLPRARQTVHLARRAVMFSAPGPARRTVRRLRGQAV